MISMRLILDLFLWDLNMHYLLKNKDRCEKNEIHWVWNVKFYYCLPLIISFLLSFNFRGFSLGCTFRELYSSFSFRFRFAVPWRSNGSTLSFLKLSLCLSSFFRLPFPISLLRKRQRRMLSWSGRRPEMWGSRP